MLVKQQFHNYAHVPGCKATVFQGDDAQRNGRCARGENITPAIAEALYSLWQCRLAPCAGRRSWLRRTDMKLRFEAGVRELGLLPRLSWRGLQLLGWRTERNLKLHEALREITIGVPNAASVADSGGQKCMSR